jgi:hypothetical protein
MSKKKNSKLNKTNNFPYSNEIKRAKEGCKQMIDEMSDEEFLDFAFMLTLMIENLENDLDSDFDEELWDDEDVPF